MPFCTSMLELKPDLVESSFSLTSLTQKGFVWIFNSVMWFDFMSSILHKQAV